MAFARLKRPKRLYKAGADALGFNFWPASPRFIDARRGAQDSRRAPRSYSLQSAYLSTKTRAVCEKSFACQPQRGPVAWRRDGSILSRPCIQSKLSKPSGSAKSSIPQRLPIPRQRDTVGRESRRPIRRDGQTVFVGACVQSSKVRARDSCGRAYS